MSIKNVKLRNIDVTGYDGPLVSINNVSECGLNGTTVNAPKLADPIFAPSEKFRLR